MEPPDNNVPTTRIFGGKYTEIANALRNKKIEDISRCAKNIFGTECNYKKYIGFDCANKSLGYTVAFVNTNLRNQIEAADKKLWSFLEISLGKEFERYKKSTEKLFAARTLVQTKKATDEFNAEADVFIREIMNSNIKEEIGAQLASYITEIYFLKITYFAPVSCGVIDLIPGKKLKDSTILERTRALKAELAKIIISGEVRDDAIILIEDQPTILNSKSTTIQDQICYEFAANTVIMVPPKLKNMLCFGEELSYDEIRKKYAKKYTANKVHSKLNFLKFISIISEEKMTNNIRADNYDDLADSTMQILAFVKNEM